MIIIIIIAPSQTCWCTNKCILGRQMRMSEPAVYATIEIFSNSYRWQQQQIFSKHKQTMCIIPCILYYNIRHALSLLLLQPTFYYYYYYKLLNKESIVELKSQVFGQNLLWLMWLEELFKTHPSNGFEREKSTERGTSRCSRWLLADVLWSMLAYGIVVNIIISIITADCMY